MRNTHERLQKIEVANERGYIITLCITLLFVVSLWVLSYELLLWFALFYGLILYRFLVCEPRRWKKLFLTEFCEINPTAIQKTTDKLQCPFDVVAKAVVVSLQDEWDGDTLLRPEFETKAKKIYRSFLLKET